MSHFVTKIACAAAFIATTAVITPVAAFAQPPLIEQVQVQDTFPDPFLTEACGVPVTTTVSGMITIISFAEEGTGPIQVRAINVGLTATAGDNRFRFRDVGVDLVRIEPDGTAVLSIVGQIPFEFTGLLRIDLDTGEAILEPHHFLDPARACSMLTG